MNNQHSIYRLGNYIVTELIQKWQLLTSISLISSTKEMNPITRKSKIVKISNTAKFHKSRPETHAKRQTLDKPENKRQMYSRQFTQALLPYICLLFSYVIPLLSPFFFSSFPPILHQYNDLEVSVRRFGGSGTTRRIL